MIASMRRYIITGLIIMVPLLTTVALVQWLIGFSDQLLALLPAVLHPDNLLGMHIPGLGVIVALLLLITVGFVAGNFIGRHFIEWFEALLTRVPLVRSIYGAVKQMMEAAFGGGAGGFRQVVWVSFPQPGHWTIGFVTGPARLPIDELLQRGKVAVFIPTTPNPTSGWLLYVDEAELIPLPITVEDGMKMVISGGMITPEAAKVELPAPQKGA